MNEVGAYGRPKLQGVADSPKEAATNLNKKDNDYGNDCKNQWQCKLKFYTLKNHVMLNFAQLKFLLTGLTLLTVLAACSDDNTSTEAPPATIEIAELSPEADNVSFRLIPTNAISMAYKIEIEGGG